MFTAVLRPGNAPAKAGAIGTPRRILQWVWEAFPKARVRVRLDGGFADPQLLDFLDAMGVEYVIATAKNAVPERLAEPEMQEARRLSQRSGETEHVYGEGCYRAGIWRRRVIFKAEVVRLVGKEPKDNPRFVITSRKQSPQWIYEQAYCQRGEIENRIKELHAGLEDDRTSCTRFWANRFRVLTTTAVAYVLMQELHLRASCTACAGPKVWTLREPLLKLRAQVVASVRRVVIHSPVSFPYQSSFRQIARSFGTLSGWPVPSHSTPADNPPRAARYGMPCLQKPPHPYPNWVPNHRDTSQNLRPTPKRRFMQRKLGGIEFRTPFTNRAY